MSRRNLLSNTYPVDRAVILPNRENVNLSYDLVIRKLKNGYEPEQDGDSGIGLWDSPVFASEFCPESHNQPVLAYANEFGNVLLWNMKRSVVRPVHRVEAHNNAIFDLTWTAREMKFVTVSGDKSAVLWDTNGPSIEKISTFNGHAATVKSAAWNPDSDYVFSSGDRNSTVFVWDTRTTKPENVIYNAHDRSKVFKHVKKPYYDGTSVTGLVFYGPHYLITCAAVSEGIRIWDLRKYYATCSGSPRPVQEFKHADYDDKSGYAYLTIDQSRHWLYATSVHDRVYSFALNTPQITPTAVFVGACIRSFYVKSCLSADGQYLVSGTSTDCSVVWKTKENGGRIVKPMRKLDTYGIEVNAVSWSKTPSDLHKIATFPECRPMEVWELNPLNVPEDLWDIMAPIPEVGAIGSGIEVSDIDEKSKLNERSKEGLSELSYQICSVSKSDVSIPLSGDSKQSECRNCDNQAQKKRMALEILGNCSEERQTKKIKLRRTLSPRKLFVHFNRNDSNEIDSVKQISCPTMSCDILQNDYLPCASTSQLVANNQEGDGDVKENNMLVLHCEESPFSPTSNLPNHVIDGTSPTHVCKPYRKKHVDWLTKLRHRKVADCEKGINKRPSEFHLRRSEFSKKAQKRRHESILKFFRVLGKSTDDQLKSSQSCQGVSSDHSS